MTEYGRIVSANMSKGSIVCFQCKEFYDYDMGTQKNCSIVEIAKKCPKCGYVEPDFIP